MEQAASLVTAHLGLGPTIIDVPLVHAAWLQWLTQAGFTEQRPFVRMRKGVATGKRAHPSEFAILGPEFG